MIRKRSSKGCHLLFSLHGPLAISGYTLWIYLLALVLVWTMAGFKRLFFFFFGRNLFCAMNCHILLKLQTYISECRTLWIFLNSMACILDTSILVQFQYTFHVAKFGKGGGGKTFPKSVSSECWLFVQKRCSQSEHQNM